MEEKYRKLFGHLDQVEPPKELEKQIVARVDVEEKNIILRRVFIFGSGTIVALTVLASAINSLREAVIETGFHDYLYLLVSGDRTVLAYWKELSLSLIETMPIFSLVVFLAVITFLIWSFANTVTNFRRFNFSLQLK